ncbi:class 1 fructose-bisphosphatase [Thermoflexibacter ruber]|uniref:Fructose-1,6-bisphosphatase class 1 n=1 Tax=Thermoflexibacter ruber TaxID=1003 RepID=A0A1I2J912_9BACT|nr:class 1 fructose-bisphosphatase [Thermoflexibacter ruber]SFF50548.1 D-fructose 1,6-bisphosphatase [Thermoflexibacter ruber]
MTTQEKEANVEIKKFVASIGITLDRFISQRQQEFPYAKGELSQILRDIGLAAKVVNKAIMGSGLIGIEGPAGERNVQGEEQQKLDVVANMRFIRALTKGQEVCAIISEEDEEMIDTGNHEAKYIVAMDPLDGSSNIDANVPIGTIFSIYRRKSPVGTPPTTEDVLQKGANQVAGGYVLYGSSMILTYTTGYGVNGFTYDHTIGEFILSYPNMKIKELGSIFSYNEGNYNDFSEGTKAYLTYCRNQKYTARYIGSLVADFHRNLLKGGIFFYPATSKSPNGKLRLLYECNSLAFVIEQAGGKATDGKRRILDIEPHDIHQRSPLIIGSSAMVDDVMQFIKNEQFH